MPLARALEPSECSCCAATPAKTLAGSCSQGWSTTNPDWDQNLTTAGDGSVKRGTETCKVMVRELSGAERDHISAEQARR